MAQCGECTMLVNNQCSLADKAEAILGRNLGASSFLGACEVAIVKSYLQYIQPGMRVLEVGCGSWDLIKNHCDSVGAHYDGIDTQAEYFGKKSVATRLENLANLSFSDDSFDIVLGNQTMEHWGEYGCNLSWGLYQCFRVCKPNGKVLMNVPIHFHGTKIFFLGKLDKIQEAFQPFSTQVTLNPWGYPSNPIPPYFPYPAYQGLRNHPAYLLDVQAIKDKPLPTNCSNRGAMSGLMARLLNVPFSYLLYRLQKSIGFVKES